jgi:circadian clock protein KaiC
MQAVDNIERVSPGMSGLDDIPGGGLDANKLYLLEGASGPGKTTLALQFLLCGVSRGEKVPYITLSESESELRLVAARHGCSLQRVRIFVPPEASHGPDHEVTLFHPSELELGETTKLIFEQVRQNEPTRVVFDSLSEMHLLAQNSLRYRRQILAPKHFFGGRKCTVLLLDDLSSHADDLLLHSIAHGVICLEQLALDYGAERRRLRVSKMRGIAFRGGYHDFTIEHGGLSIFPRLIAAEHHKLKELRGVLTGTPNYVGQGKPLMRNTDHAATP